MAQDKVAEIRQGEKIADYAAFAWNWGTPAGRSRVDRRAEYLINLGKKEGGIIFFSEPNIMNPLIMMQRFIPFMRLIFQETQNERAFNRWGLKRFLEKEELFDIDIKPYDFLYPLTPSYLIEKVDYLSRRLEKILFIREIAGSLLIYARKAHALEKGDI
ncbi:MAG: hypothetical protein ABH843_07695 [Candidatus Omnitrophota bacterium]